MHFAYLSFLIHDAVCVCVRACVQDGRIKVGDRVVAVADEPVAGLSADKVQTRPSARNAPYTLQGQANLMIYESSFYSGVRFDSQTSGHCQALHQPLQDSPSLLPSASSSVYFIFLPSLS